MENNYCSYKNVIIICTVITFILIVIASILIYIKHNSKIESRNKSLTYIDSNVITLKSSDDINNKKPIVDELKHSKTERDMSKVKMAIKDEEVTSEGIEIIIEDKNETPYVYDSWFEIEKLENNEWKKLQYRDDYVSDDIGYMIYVLKDGKLEEKINWSKEYGILDRGKYKLIKRCIDEDNIYKYIEIEFEIK